MEIIAHRRNSTGQLTATPTKFGVEVDVRSEGDELIVQHDPFAKGEKFEIWISSFQHGTLIINVKEEGLEERIETILTARGVKKFFFLDQSFPFIIKCARRGERRCAVRVSQFESTATALNLAGLIDWVWVDYFKPVVLQNEQNIVGVPDFPFNEPDLLQIKKAGFKLCLVSPELQGWPADESIPYLRTHLDKSLSLIDAVCTKRWDLWAK
ncbi:hypothetical protein [Methylobacterium longum]|uniref:GP-PDE domain-containing protein n=1 Tax=Methylobacterium longum TaxID=767694 RepID=A0ABT8AV48_9HYPH|nr:hypothetical protein [Methylobacterium longum]MDN3573832.1 hypothetical protein [Methylobacterium longum]